MQHKGDNGLQLAEAAKVRQATCRASPSSASPQLSARGTGPDVSQPRTQVTRLSLSASELLAALCHKFTHRCMHAVGRSLNFTRSSSYGTGTDA
jgi:hypothetical protein